MLFLVFSERSYALKNTFILRHNNKQWEKILKKNLPKPNRLLLKSLKIQYPDKSENFITNIMLNDSKTEDSYQVVEVEKGNKDKITKATFSFFLIENWHCNFNKALKIFENQFKRAPLMIIMNKNTLKALEEFMSQEDIVKQSSQFKNISLRIRIDRSMLDNDFCLAFGICHKITLSK